MKVNNKFPQITSWLGLRRVSMIFISLAALVIITTVSIYAVNTGRKIENVFINERNHSQLLAQIISDEFELVVSDLMILSESENLQALLASEDTLYKEALSQDFLSFATRKGLYDQIRYLDETGIEIMRVNFNDGKPSIVPENQLQDKGGRYYFQDTFQLDVGEVFVSPLDLNIEHGEIEQPQKPMIRFSTPVFDNIGQKQGIVILNYFGAKLIQRLELEEPNILGQVMLLNSDGYWLKGSTPEDEWGFMYPDRNELIFGNTYPDAWQPISAAESGQFQNKSGLFTFNTIHPLLEAWKSSTGSGGAFEPSEAQLESSEFYWKVVLHVPLDTLNTITRENVEGLVILDIVLIITIATGAWITSRNVDKRKQVEEVLVENEGRLKTIMDSLQSGFLVVNAETHVIVDANPAAVEMLAAPKEQIIGHVYHKVICSSEVGECPITDLGQTMDKTESVLTNAKGESIPILKTVIPIILDGKRHFLENFIDITERVQAEEELRKHRDHLEELVEERTAELTRAIEQLEILVRGVGAGLSLLDSETKIVWANDILQGWFGPIKEIEGKYCHELYMLNNPEEECSALRTLCSGKFEQGIAFAYDIQNERRFFQLHTMPIKNERGEITNIVELTLDITEREQAEHELRRLKNFNESIIQHMLEGILVMDIKGIITFINPAASVRLGYLPEEIIGQHWKAIVPPDQKKIVDRAEDRRARGDKDHYELILTSKNGTRIPMLVGSGPRYEEGQFVGSIAVFTDISERKQAEEALGMSEQRYSTLFNETRDGIVLVNAKTGQIEDCNPSFENITGRNIDELRKMKIWEIRPSEKVEMAKKMFLEIIETGSGGADDLDCQQPDGSIVPIEFTSAVINILGKLVVLSSVRDVTERKQAEELQNAVYRIAQATVVSPRLEDLYPTIHEIISDVMPTENFYIALYDEKEDILSFPYYVDEVDAFPPPQKPGKGLTEYVLHTGETLLCDEAYHQELMKRGEADLIGESSPIWLGVPLIIEDTTIGVMTVQHYTDPEAYGEREKRMLKYVSSQVAKSIEHKKLEEAIQKRTHDLGERVKEINCLYSISKLTETLKPSLEEIFQGTVDLIPPAWQYPEITCARLKLDGRMFSSSNFKESAWKQASNIMVKGKRSGVLEVYYMEERPESEEGPFLKEERNLIDAIAVHLGKAIERRQVEEQVKRQLKRMSALHEIDMAITSTLDLRVTLNVILNEVSSQLDVDAANILLLKPANILSFAAEKGFNNLELIQTARIGLGENLAGKVALERQMIYITDLREHEASPGFADLVSQEGFVSYYGVPLIAKGNLVGVLEIFHRSALDPVADWLRFLETLAGQTAIVISNAVLFDDLQATKIAMEVSYVKTLEGWVRALDMRDKETEGHTQRVTDMTLRLASYIKIPNDELIHYARGALLHDIGKMAISDEIFHKPGSFTDEEQEVMREHPTYARNFLVGIEYLEPALDIPYYHHERWDGTGYPQGLKGEQIPLAARIFAIIDVWDAMLSDRPYRKAWSKKKALTYIKDQAGTHFDPSMVRAFLEMVGEK